MISRNPKYVPNSEPTSRSNRSPILVTALIALVNGFGSWEVWRQWRAVKFIPFEPLLTQYLMIGCGVGLLGTALMAKRYPPSGRPAFWLVPIFVVLTPPALCIFLFVDLVPGITIMGMTLLIWLAVLLPAWLSWRAKRVETIRGPNDS